MPGSLALQQSLLFVGREEKTAYIRAFDLDGHRRLEGFSFRDHRLGRSVAAGLAVDEDRRIWVADTPVSRVRRFLVFGREEGGIGLGLQEPVQEPPWPDARGLVRGPVAVAVTGNGEEGRLLIGLAGRRRHAVQVFDINTGYRLSPQPMGEAHGHFRDVRGVAMRGRFLFVAEADGQRVQVFRDDSFHFAIRITCATGQPFEPVAVAPLEDGNLVIACAGRESALLLVSGSGRLLRVLASEGESEGSVFHPAGVVAEAGRAAAATRIAVIDRDGERVQVFTLEGRCYGTIELRA